MKHFLFDLDETLVDTSKLKTYMKTGEGRTFVIQNINDLDTTLYDSCLVTLVKTLHKRNAVSIASNAPVSYVHAVLTKHGFPNDVPIFGSLGKPVHHKLLSICREKGVAPNDVLLVDDAAIGVLAAHGAAICSAAVTWGNTSSQAQLEEAEPQRMIDDPASLEAVIIEFEKDKITHAERTYPAQFRRWSPEEGTRDISITWKSLGNYYPRGTYSDKRNILTFKSAKKVSVRDINAGATDKYFYNGAIRQGASFIGILGFFSKEVVNGLNALELQGTTYLIAAPNSAPDFCYKTDINVGLMRMVAQDYAKNNGATFPEIKTRLVKRISPVKEQHIHGRVTTNIHLTTMGLIEGVTGMAQPDNVVIFDDVTTSGTQINSIAKLLASSFPEANLYGLTLAKTAY